jgi:hypothetical protein
MYHLICYLVACTLTTVYGAGQLSHDLIQIETIKQFLMTKLLEKGSNSAIQYTIPLSINGQFIAVKTDAQYQHILILIATNNHEQHVAEIIYDSQQKKYREKTVYAHIRDCAISKDGSIMALATQEGNVNRIAMYKNGQLVKNFYPFTYLARLPPYDMQISAPTYANQTIDSITLSDAGTSCIVQSKHGTIEFFDTENGTVFYTTNLVIQHGISRNGNSIFALCQKKFQSDEYLYKIIRNSKKSFLTTISVDMPKSQGNLPCATLDDRGEHFAYFSQQKLYVYALMRGIPLIDTNEFNNISHVISLNFLDSDTIEIDTEAPRPWLYTISTQTTKAVKNKYLKVKEKNNTLTIIYRSMDLKWGKGYTPTTNISLVSEFKPHIFKDTNLFLLATDFNNQLMLLYFDLLGSNRKIIESIDTLSAMQKKNLQELYKNKIENKGSIAEGKKLITIFPKPLQTLFEKYLLPPTPILPFLTTIWDQSTTLLNSIRTHLHTWWQKIHPATHGEPK